MIAKENMHEVRFQDIYIVSHIIYYIVPLTINTLTINIVFAIKAVGFSKIRQTLSTIMVISKIKCELFLIEFFIILH